MKWNIWYRLRGAGGVIEVPNCPSQVECESLPVLLASLEGQFLPTPSENNNSLAIPIEVVGLRIERVED